MTNRQMKRAARRLYRLCLVDGSFDEIRARSVAARLAGSGRRGAQPVLWEFLRLARLDQARRTAVVESAEPLPSEVQDDVSARLGRTYGAGVKPTFAVNPALLGGMRIRMGSDVYDGSVRARLAALQSRL